jgi:hypothetical protein
VAAKGDSGIKDSEMLRTFAGKLSPEQLEKAGQQVNQWTAPRAGL